MVMPGDARCCPRCDLVVLGAGRAVTVNFDPEIFKDLVRKPNPKGLFIGYKFSDTLVTIAYLDKLVPKNNQWF